MGPVKIDFSKISGTSLHVKPILPLKKDFGVMFYERDTRDMYVYDNFEWSLWGRGIEHTIVNWVDLQDTPSSIEPGKIPIGNITGDAIEWTDFPVIPTPIDPTGLEAINEGNGIGWRLIGRDPAFYGNIGLNATDLSFSDTVGSVNGALGIRSVTYGDHSGALGDSDLVGGWNNFTLANGGNNIMSGGNNSATESLNYSLVTGDHNLNRGWGLVTAGSTNSNRGHSTGYNYSAVFGKYNYSLLTGGIMAGQGLHGDSTSTAIFGQSNVSYAGSNGVPNKADDPIFILGNGRINNDGSSQTRSDAFRVLLDGTVTANSLTSNLILADTTGRVVLTKEVGVSNETDTYTSNAKATNIITLTQVEYDAISTPVPGTWYAIIG